MMQRQLTNDWIDEQLAICEAEVNTRGYLSSIPDPYKYPAYLAFVSAAREGYPLVLERLQDTQGELRLVFSILEGLLLGMDDLPYENIKSCIASLVCAGSSWLEKESERDKV